MNSHLKKCNNHTENFKLSMMDFENVIKIDRLGGQMKEHNDEKSSCVIAPPKKFCGLHAHDGFS